MKDKSVFKLHELDVEKFAYSLGLANAPQVTVLPRISSSEAADPTKPKETKQERALRLRAEAKARKAAK